ncbi:MAG: fibronectin type III domain-containing protein [Solirubrobacteraceae bacterium]|nr:fibronectin type III domain-containing protein [Solirubrobacteraceae bacterium]
MASPLSWVPSARRAATIGVIGAALSALAVAPASARPVSLKLNYKCNFPLMLPEPLSLTITSDVPATLPVDEGSPEIPINAVADVSAKAVKSLRALEAVSVEGKAAAAATVVRPDGIVLPLNVPTTIVKTALPTSGPVQTAASGEAPSILFPSAGQAALKVGDLVLTLTPRLSDGLLTGVDTFETECKQDPGQNNVLATIAVTDGSASVAPTKPGALKGVPTSSSVALSWTASTDDKAVTAYDVFRDGTKVTTVTTNSATIAGLNADTNYTFTVQARDADNNASELSDPVTVKTAAGGGTTGYRYAVAGTATFKSLSKGAVPLTGAFDTSIAGSTVSGNLALNDAAAKLVALGFLPVDAKLSFAQAGGTSGTFASGVLSTTTKLRIKLPQVKVLGIELAGGANCQTKQISSVGLKSIEPAFSPAAGGRLAGTFAISDLTGCGFLTNLVSPLTSGGSNAIAVNLTPNPVA